MIDEEDTYRAATLVIAQHGKDAVRFAAARAEELLSLGDIEGLVAWKQILSAVRDIQAPATPDDSLN